MPELFAQRQRALHTDVRVDVVELREAAEETEAGFLHGLAHRRHILAVRKIVNGISIEEADDLFVGDGVRMDEPDPGEIRDHALEHLLVVEIPDAIAFIRGDLGHDARASRRYTSLAEGFRE